jgi:hypothetical protein
MQLLGEHIALKANFLGSLHAHRLLWTILTVTAFFDFASTLFFMSEVGIQVEQNRVIRFLAVTFGIIPGVAIGKCLQLVAAAGLCALAPKHARAILLLIVLLNLVAILINVLLVPHAALT